MNAKTRRAILRALNKAIAEARAPMPRSTKLLRAMSILDQARRDIKTIKKVGSK
jgi:hypothetical protein